MVKQLIEVTIDSVSIPTYEDLRKFRVDSLRVRVQGPAGGNPALTLKFPNVGVATKFLTEWYGLDPKGETSEPPEFFLPSHDYSFLINHKTEGWRPMEIAGLSAQDAADTLIDAWCEDPTGIWLLATDDPNAASCVGTLYSRSVEDDRLD